MNRAPSADTEPLAVLFIATALYSAEGGLERFNQRVTRCLAEYRASGRVSRATALALADGGEHAARAPAGIEFVAGRSGNVRTALAFLLLLRYRFDVILYGHVGFAPLAIVGRVLRPRTRHLLIVHGVEVWRRPTLLRGLAARRFFDAIVAVSRFSARRMGSFFRIAGERFLILPNAVDVEEGPDAPGAGDAAPLEGRFRLLSVSRLSLMDRYKNIDKVIAALPRILESYPETHYYVVGDGPWRPDLERLAAESGLAGHVHFLGHIDDAARDSLYARSHIFILPSTMEGFGIVFLEAWRKALPPICSDQDAASEVVRHGVDGLSVPPESSRIADAVCSLLSDPQRREAMGREGRKRLVDRYNHDRFRERLLEILMGAPPCAV
jgi:glycosyltransferase involved in cell wall biosynthesis